LGHSETFTHPDKLKQNILQGDRRLQLKKKCQPDQRVALIKGLILYTGAKNLKVILVLPVELHFPSEF